MLQLPLYSLPECEASSLEPTSIIIRVKYKEKKLKFYANGKLIDLRLLDIALSGDASKVRFYLHEGVDAKVIDKAVTPYKSILRRSCYVIVKSD